MKYREETRRTTVEGAKVVHLRNGDMLFPKVFFDNGDPPEEVWLVILRYRHGLSHTSVATVQCFSEEEANSVARHASEPNQDLPFPALEAIIHANLRDRIDCGALDLGKSDISDDEAPLAYNVLIEAGITNASGEPSVEVLEFIGPQREQTLRTAFGENWACVAIYEFCNIRLPESSAAFAAASHQFHLYVTGDLLSAGYYWRDMEVAASEAELIAAKSIEMRRKAGERGREASERARKTRKRQLVEAMEKLCRRNPDFALIGEGQVARLALRDMQAASPKLWSEGKGQIDQYLAEIRHDHDDMALKARLEAIFPTKPPRR